MSPDPAKPPRRRPAGRSVTLAIIFSLLIPGLGHVYIGRFGRALIWFAGAIGIGVILDQQSSITPAALVVLTVLGVLAAVDAMVMLKFFQPTGARK